MAAWGGSDDVDLLVLVLEAMERRSSKLLGDWRGTKEGGANRGSCDGDCAETVSAGGSRRGGGVARGTASSRISPPCNLAVMRLVEQHGRSFAFPTQTIEFAGAIAERLVRDRDGQPR